MLYSQKMIQKAGLLQIGKHRFGNDVLDDIHIRDTHYPSFFPMSMDLK